ncbi:hypothetical protein [Dyella mobilis]|uniref:Uncharacterized protein n=1 Tax=Dyella mobilis TaxID=1849582 RepID=A0ABS2KEL3_9GAMM|nr:hypothetical protein [Dyella mobilis]MBM7129379.1 hypothetical protein [Dyella mobilis]GLQ98674.1 hypothetical protein GCM10007863_30940 [Dyella mobilis]
MPLYTYVVSYRGASHVAQGSHSNFKGFISTWCSNIPSGALPDLTPSLHKELVSKAYQGDFMAVPNKVHVWRKSIEVGGNECLVVAVQTER